MFCLKMLCRNTALWTKVCQALLHFCFSKFHLKYLNACKKKMKKCKYNFFFTSVHALENFFFLWLLLFQTMCLLSNRSHSTTSHNIILELCLSIASFLSSLEIDEITGNQLLSLVTRPKEIQLTMIIVSSWKLFDIDRSVDLSN